MISLFEKLANSLLQAATHDSRQRRLLTPLLALFFLCFLALFIIAAVAVDRWLGLPSIGWMPWTLIAGLALLIPGAILWIWTVALFLSRRGTPVPINPPPQLVTTGPYSFCRNPMVLGIILVFFGIGLCTGSLSLTFIFSPLLVIIMTLYHKNVEEKELELQFGQQYIDYRKRVPMYFPWFKGRG